MKITNLLFCLPPYLSTTWDNIASLHMRETTLAVTLNNGDTVLIPNLPQEALNKIFMTHATVLEIEEKMEQSAQGLPFSPQNGIIPFLQFVHSNMSEIPFQIGMTSADGVATPLQHDPSAADADDIPAEILEKIVSVVRAISNDDLESFPIPEPECNCPHCQITHALKSGGEKSKTKQSVSDEIVLDCELEFQQWTIEQAGDNLFTVTNKLDADESYSVHLGAQVGCTCGKNDCEHIIAVLRS